MARRRRQREEVSNDRWVVSYADFITLLLAFFVVMYAISSVNEGKYRALSESLEGIFSGPQRSLDPIAVGDVSLAPGQRDIGLLDSARHQAGGGGDLSPGPKAALAALETSARHRFKDLIDDGRISVSGNRFWLELEMSANLLFESGKGTVSDAALEVLEGMAGLLAGYDNPLQIEGFTDDRPIETKAFPSNWELSAARAASVVRVLNHYGVAEERLAAVGYGASRPKVSNLTARGRSKNRRVVIVVARDVNALRARGGLGGVASVDQVEAFLAAEATLDRPAAGGVQRVEREDGEVLFTQGGGQPLVPRPVGQAEASEP